MMNTHVRDNLLYLKSQVSAHIILSGASIIPSTTQGCAVPVQIEMTSNDQNILVPAFADGTTNYGQWTLPYLPDDYNGGTMTAKFIWTQATSSTNNVTWACQGRAYGNGDNLDVAWGTQQVINDSGTASAYPVNISSATPAITLGGTPAAGKMAQFRVYRAGTDGSDTLTQDAYLLGVLLTYTRS